MTSLHNIIYEVPLNNGLHALIDEKLEGHYIFRIAEYADSKADVRAVANVSEHDRFPEFECYTEAVKLDKPLTIEDFRPLYEFLEFHITWFKRAIDVNATPVPYVISREYYNRVYSGRKDLMRSQR